MTDAATIATTSASVIQIHCLYFMTYFVASSFSQLERVMSRDPSHSSVTSDVKITFFDGDMKYL